MHFEWNKFASNWNHGRISCDVHFAGHLRSNRTNIWSDKSNIRNMQSGGARGLELRTAGLTELIMNRKQEGPYMGTRGRETQNMGTQVWQYVCVLCMFIMCIYIYIHECIYLRKIWCLYIKHIYIYYKHIRVNTCKYFHNIYCILSLYIYITNIHSAHTYVI